MRRAAWMACRRSGPERLVRSGSRGIRTLQAPAPGGACEDLRTSLPGCGEVGGNHDGLGLVLRGNEKDPAVVSPVVRFLGIRVQLGGASGDLDVAYRMLQALDASTPDRFDSFLESSFSSATTTEALPLKVTKAAVTFATSGFLDAPVSQGSRSISTNRSPAAVAVRFTSSELLTPSANGTKA